MNVVTAIDTVKVEVRESISEIMKKSGLPITMMDMVLDSIQLEIKQAKAEAYALEIREKEAKQTKEGE